MPETPSTNAPSTGPKPAKTNAPGGNAETEQVKDQASEHLSPDEVANAAAESLHGDGAVKEQYVQPAANALAGGNTLIAASTDAEAAKEGERRA
jgi:hypothetical protein